MKNNIMKNKKIKLGLIIILWICAILIGPLYYFALYDLNRTANIMPIQLAGHTAMMLIRNFAYYAIGYLYYDILSNTNKISFKQMYNKKILIRLIVIQLTAVIIQQLVIQGQFYFIDPFFAPSSIFYQVCYIMWQFIACMVLVAIVGCIRINSVNEVSKGANDIYKDKKVILIIIICIAIETMYNYYLCRASVGDLLANNTNIFGVLSWFSIKERKDVIEKICEGLIFMYIVIRQFKVDETKFS